MATVECLTQEVPNYANRLQARRVYAPQRAEKDSSLIRPAKGVIAKSEEYVHYVIEVSKPQTHLHII